MPSITEIGEGAELTARLVNNYTIGAMASAANIVGGADLMASSVDLLTSVGVDTGYGGEGIEAGALAVIGRAAAANFAKKASQKAGKSMLAAPAQWGKAIAFAGVPFAGYSWLSNAQNLKIAQNAESAKLLGSVLETLTPADRMKIARILAEGIGGGDGMSWAPWIVGAAVLGLGAFVFLRR